MRVAIDIGPLYGHRSGVAVATEGMVAALGEHSEVALNPYLISFRAEPAPDHRRLPLPGIVASHVWSRAGVPRADRWLGGVDVVHGTNYVVPPSRLPSVVSVYDTWFFDHPELASPIVRRAGNNLRRAIGRGAVVHTTSQSTADNVARILDTDRVRVAHLGLPPDVRQASSDECAALRQQLDLPGDEPSIIVAIGTEERRKDLPLLVEAFDRLAAHLAGQTDVALVLAGAPGDSTDDVTAAIERLPVALRGRVRRLGPVDSVVKSALLTVGHVLAYPSLDEGFGFPILEAQALELPVVARAVGSIPETGGDGVALVDERSADRLAETLGAVLIDGELRRRLVADGSANLRRFSWHRAADELVDIYRFAIDHR